MRQVFAGLALLFMAFSPIYGMRITQLPGDIALPLPDGWEVVDSTSGFPYLVAHFDQRAELTIHQSVLRGDQIIANQADFKVSVDSVVSGIILDLPEARLLNTIGMQDGNWAAFALEFESWDNDIPSEMRHRLAGVLYYHSDGYQLLFTLWARAAPEDWPMLIDDILLMQGGFIYLGPADKNALGGDDWEIDWIYLIVPLLGIGFAQILRARAQRRRTPERQQPQQAASATSSDPI
jgi:hypothetical protein